MNRELGRDAVKAPDRKRQGFVATHEFWDEITRLAEKFGTTPSGVVNGILHAGLRVAFIEASTGEFKYVDAKGELKAETFFRNGHKTDLASHQETEETS